MDVSVDSSEERTLPASAGLPHRRRCALSQGEEIDDPRLLSLPSSLGVPLLICLGSAAVRPICTRPPSIWDRRTSQALRQRLFCSAAEREKKIDGQLLWARDPLGSEDVLAANPRHVGCLVVRLCTLARANMISRR